MNRPPPSAGGGVAADGAVGQRDVAASLYRPPPLPSALPPVIVSPEIDAVTPASTWNTRLSPPPLTVTPAAGPVIVSVPVVSLSSSWLPRQGDRLRRLEHRLVKGDRLGPPVRIRLADRLAQVDLAGDGRVGAGC